jgi:hypothetical protein
MAGDDQLGIPGDVTGDGNITAYDAVQILKSTVEGDESLPTYQKALAVSQGLTAYGNRCNVMDIMSVMADVDGGGIGAHDASLVLQHSAGLINEFSCESCAPIADMTARNARLRVNSLDGQNLEVSIDLDNVADVHSADIVMTYNPQTLKLTDVSGTSALSGWLSAHGETGAGQLRISLAGAYQPVADGSLVTVNFDLASADAIKQLDIAEFKLNGGRLKLEIENLPKSFALMQNYPNPFNPETWIPYQLSEPADVAITIFNLNGQIVRRLELGTMMPGSYVDKVKAAYWDGANEWGEKVSSGIYFYQLQAGRDASVRKMIIMK